MTSRSASFSGAQPGALAVAVSTSGACIGIVYASSIFYSASGSAGRTASRLAIHEITLASGFVCGCLVGGMLTEYVSLRAAYPVCSAMILLGLGLQLLIARRHRVGLG